MKTEVVFRDYAPFPNHLAEMKKNPGARVFREIEITVQANSTTIKMGSVGVEAAEGRYRHQPVDPKATTIPTSLFFEQGAAFAAEPVLARETFATVQSIIRMRDEIREVLPNMTKIFTA